MLVIYAILMTEVSDFLEMFTGNGTLNIARNSVTDSGMHQKSYGQETIMHSFQLHVG